jgi:dienelactone hydrolase
MGVTLRWLATQIAVGLVAVVAIATALWALKAADGGHAREAVTLDGTPAIVYRPLASGPGVASVPVVVIAHGFAGSQQLMQAFAVTLSRNGYIAVTFDFPGHGRNPAPLSGSITEVTGATQRLVASTQSIVAYAKTIGDGRVALLGHSMASDIIVRVAQADPAIAATVAVSMFSPAVTATTPKNLLVIVGNWEGALKQEALRAIGLSTAPASAEPGVTYGDPLSGTGRRAAFSRAVEHVGVLYSQDSLREALAWLDETFAIKRAQAPVLDPRGPWIALLLAGIVILARPLSCLLPQVAAQPIGASVGWRELWPMLLIPTLLTPLILRVLPTHFLPVLVADYLAAHFAAFGVITAVCLAWRQQKVPAPLLPPISALAVTVATLAVVAFQFVGVVWPLNTYVTSFVPGPERIALVVAMTVGTLAYFLADEWLTRGPGTARGAYLASKVAFLVSLAMAVVLDFERLFFLVIIIPVIVLFFLVYGLFSSWIYKQTHVPWVAALANALAFAWAIGVSFPLLAG